MNHINKLIDLPVITKTNSEKLGVVTDVILDKSSMKIATFVITTKGIIPVKKYLPFEKALSIENNKIWVKDKDSLIKANENQNDVSFQKEVQGCHVLKNGEKLGSISDAIFNNEIGEIVNFEVSNGFTEDILNGRSSVTLKNVFIGNKEILLKDTKGEA